MLMQTPMRFSMSLDALERRVYRCWRGAVDGKGMRLGELTVANFDVYPE